MGGLWEVVGGGDKGGIVVRAGRQLTSAELPARLEKSSVVEELARNGDRLKYKLLSGNGPQEGWVSIRLKDKVLLEARDEMPKTASSSGFEMKVKELREEFPGCIDLSVPKEATDWSDADLHNFFESGGFIKPLPKEAPPPLPPPGVIEGPQFTVPEALQLQEKLLAAFKNSEFQQKLKRLQLQHPQRKQKGHRDGPAYFEAFEVLVMTVFCCILPSHGLRGDWDGVRDMFAQMASALAHSKVKKQHEEINTLLGLPRDARLAASRQKDSDSLVYCPGGDGTVQLPGRSCWIEDEDGDVAHEFLVEDEATGELCDSFAADIWFQALQPVAIRATPSIKSASVGVCTKGQRFLVQRIVDDRWLQLHKNELQVLGVAEAWILFRDGTNHFLERILEKREKGTAHW